MAELYELDGNRVLPTQYTAGPWRVAVAPFSAASVTEPSPPLPQDAGPVTLPWWDSDVAYHAALECRS